MARKIFLVLLTLLCMSFPVSADTLTGDESGVATGHTTVTARIELPQKDDEESEKEESESKTGDEAQSLAYIMLGAVCLGVIGTATILKNKIEAE